MNTSTYFLLLILSLVAFAPLGTVSESAYAQRAGSPEIDKLYVGSDNRLAPGAALTFTIVGTPGGEAAVRINGINRNVPLEEVSSGVYEGGYTVKRKDRITAANTVRATLRVNNRSTNETYSFPSGYGTSPETAATEAAPLTALKIERFTVTPIGRIEPGAELRFAMIGSPGAKASFTIEGVTKNVPMREVKRGNYEGGYTIRRLDHFPATADIFGTLEANGQAVGARLTQALLADAKPPLIKNVSPRDGETVAASSLTSVSATFDDSGGVGIDPKSVKVMLAGTDVTQNSRITPQFFSYRANLQSGRYPVEVIARDLAGNAVRHVWEFVVAPQVPAATLPLQVLSHVNNASVSGSATEVRGRTAPDAKVDVRVDGTASVAGFFGVTQQIHDQSLRADANGNFAFSFRPQYAVPGARYEITMNATKADLNTETRLVLFQQQ